MYLMGVDLGTSSVRVMILREDGKRMALAAQPYDISIPRPRYAEQDPDMWYQKTVLAIQKALAEFGYPAREIAALGFSGQMHGLVAVDAAGRPVRPAMIWMDQRSDRQIAAIYEKLGRAFVREQIQNTISPGFLLASLCWLREEELGSFSRIRRVMLPKDYLKYRLSGEICTDESDAAGSAAFDNVRRRWAVELLDRLEFGKELFPCCRSSTALIGTICLRAAKETGLAPGTRVINGGSDQCMQGIGNAIISEGDFACNIGTAGQISTCSGKPVFDRELRTNTFAHALPNRWNIMGACLSSGVSLKWLAHSVLGVSDFQELDRGAENRPAGCGGLLFLPYLAGERTPHLDPDARGVFFGLTMARDRFDLARAVMEGVVYSLKDCIGVLEEMGLVCRRVIASGGGANSPLWLQMQADIFEREVYRSLSNEQACLGAAITAGVGAGVYRNFEEPCGSLVQLDRRVWRPNPENVRAYRSYYPIFQELYRVNKPVFGVLAGKG